MAKPKRISKSESKPITGIVQRTTRAKQTTTTKRDGDVQPFPTIPPSPPECLMELRKYPKLDYDLFPFDRWDLDEIAKDNVTEHCLYRIDKEGLYIFGFWSYLDWWLRVSEELAKCFLCKAGETQLTNEHREFTRTLRKLETDVLTRFPAAHLAEPAFQGEAYNESKLDLLKAYRALTLFLSGTAVILWPRENLHWLTNHA
jgi:hypothetical protein